MADFDLSSDQRTELYRLVLEKLEHYYYNTSSLTVTPPLNKPDLERHLSEQSLEGTDSPADIIEEVTGMMTRHTVHTPHPRYFGLYNPRASFPGILADLITAVFNPQLAAWSHAPYAAETEQYLIRQIGTRFGLEDAHGTFATGGAEANQTALLCALQHTFPGIADHGIASLDRPPVIYASEEAHHSIAKAARTSGLGTKAVRTIPVDRHHRMLTCHLEDAIREDIQQNRRPFMLVATAGTTGTGAIDPLPALHNIAETYGLWFHADAAYGGGAALHSQLRKHLEGIEDADSITFDAHKWLSVPMGTSLFLTPHPSILKETFQIRTDYMPKDADGMPVRDPFAHSIQWSRRFIGLRLYLALRFFGWDGFEETIGRQAEMGDLLREKLSRTGWKVVNHSPFPVICFTDEQFSDDPEFAASVCQAVVRKGSSWISIYPVDGSQTLRACITNYNTGEKDLDGLIGDLSVARKKRSAMKQ